MGLLERIAEARGVEQRYSADTWLSEYLLPSTFGFGGNQYAYGAPGLVQTLAGNRASEIVQTLPGYAAALRQCPPAFSAQLVRAVVLSQARFTFRNLPSTSKARQTFGTRELGILEKPWTAATTGELIGRMEWHAGLAGNAYVLRQPGKTATDRGRLRVLRPDWVAILYGSHQEPEEAAHALDGELIGYAYRNGGLYNSDHGLQTMLPDEVAHWSPIPDPESAGVGQSWITPAIRDMQGDRLAAEHKIRFFENGATPNLVVKGIPAATKTQFDELVSMMEEKHSGVANAYRTLYLTAGADATVVGANLADLDLKGVQGSFETRIASLSRVHPVILGIAEGLAGSSLNAGNFGMARRIWADTWIYPTLQDLSACLANIIKVPGDAELWFDTADMPILREDAKDAADIEHVKMQSITQYVREGFTAESAVAAVRAQDVTLLKHTGRLSVQLQTPGQAAPVAPPARGVDLDSERHLPGKHNQKSHGRQRGRWRPLNIEAFRAERIRAETGAFRELDIGAGWSEAEADARTDRHRRDAEELVSRELPPGTTVAVNGDMYLVNREGRAPAATIEIAKAVLERLTRDNPLPESIAITFMPERLQNGSAFTVNSGRGILLAPEVQPGRFRNGFDSWFMPTAAEADRVAYTLTHEYGHALMYQQGHGAVAMRLQSEHHAEQSAYGKQDYREGYAEAFAEFYLSGGQTDSEPAQAYAREFGWRIP